MEGKYVPPVIEEAVFSLSSKGWEVVATDGTVTSLRELMVLLTLVLGLLSLWFIAFGWVSTRKRGRPKRFKNWHSPSEYLGGEEDAGVSSLVVSRPGRYLVEQCGRAAEEKLSILMLVAVVAHTVHTADNIGRPAAYHELAAVYRPPVWVPMEVTFWLVGLLALVAAVAYRKLMVAAYAKRFRDGVLLLAAYCCLSLLVLAHYLAEPPSAFSFFANATIMGQAASALLLLAWLAWVLAAPAADATKRDEEVV